MFRGSRRLAALLIVPTAVLAACSSEAKSSPKSDPAPSTTTTAGVVLSGAFGTTPTLTVPATTAPAKLTQQTISQGTGAAVAKGDTVVANYLGQTWAPKSGKANVFDSSFSRGAPAAFVIGKGQVIPGWDKALVGKKLGSRLLLTVPPADGYGASGQSSAGITGTDTLVFVVDLVAEYKPNASAPGTVVSNIPNSGLPKITNVPGKKPTITSTAGVKVPAQPTSTLLVTGSGPKIDTAKTLVLQLVQTDLATGKNTQATWGDAPQTVAAQSVLSIADKLSGQNIGSRAVALLPATPAVPASSTQAAQPAAPPEILVIDVVGQF
ncbi:MAG TPA: FKBP-type peptidyl-prolyl cis-trans isomerase [Jatrophihabitantaceae bacterium]